MARNDETGATGGSEPTTRAVTDGTQHDGAPGADDAPAVPTDAKARFREALARKAETAHRSAAGRQNTGVVQGSEVTSGGKRTFRRKTG